MLGRLLDRLFGVHHAQILALVIDHADLLALTMNSLNRGPFIGGACIGRRMLGGGMGKAPCWFVTLT